MKRCFSMVVVVLLLFGCSNENALVDRVIAFRNKLQNDQKCQFEAAVTLDYGDSIYSFRAECKTDAENNMEITVIEPTSISGIQAKISGNSGKLTFDEEMLAFEMIANNQITPICTPWLLMEALRSGYISSCGKGDNGAFVLINDSFKETEFSVEIWLNNDNVPSEAEILWDGKRIVTIKIDNFAFV